MTVRRVQRGRHGDERISAYRPPAVTSLEGLLFPDTYQVSNGENETQVIQRMVDADGARRQPGGPRHQSRHRSAARRTRS